MRVPPDGENACLSTGAAGSGGSMDTSLDYSLRDSGLFAERHRT